MVEDKSTLAEGLALKAPALVGIFHVVVGSELNIRATNNRCATQHAPLSDPGPWSGTLRPLIVLAPVLPVRQILIPWDEICR